MADQVRFGMHQRINDRHIGRLALVVGVEDQRVLSGSPSASVAETPEGHPLDGVLVLGEDRKQLRVASAWAWRSCGEAGGCVRRRRSARPGRLAPNCPPAVPRIVTSSSEMLTFSPNEA